MTERTVVWAGWPHAPAPLAAIRAARRLGPTRVVDDAGRPLPWRPTTALQQALRIAWQRVLSAGLGTLAKLLSNGPPGPAAATTTATGPVVLVVPVLPDLSHTFVYREVLAMLRQRPQWRVLVLTRNDTAPVHPEARELLGKVSFLPRDGVTRAALRVLRWLLTRRGRDLFALQRRTPGGAVGDLLDKLALRDGRHPGNAFLLADTLRALQPRHLHVYGTTWPANVALGASRLLGVPFSISSYVDFEVPWSHLMLARKAQDARFLRVVTAYCRQRLQTILGNDAPARVPVVLLGLDGAAWRERAARPGLGVIVSAARLVPKKGLHFVPAALARLRQQGLRWRWRIVGDGPQREALQQACVQHGIADLVDFLGPRDNTVVRTELMQADLALLPCIVAADGERDGIPIFLVEAMALGVPVVTTPVSGIPELVRGGDTGWLAAPGDSDALAEVLARALRDRALSAAIGDRGRAAVHGTLDVATTASALIAEIEA